VVDGEMVRKITPSAVVSTYLGCKSIQEVHLMETAKPAVFTNMFGIAIAKSGTMYPVRSGQSIDPPVWRAKEDFVSWLAGNEGKTGAS
jgi:hypothetical protein